MIGGSLRDRSLVLLEVELRRVDAHDLEVRSLVLGVQRLEVRKRRLAVVATERPELHHHDLAPEIVERLYVGLQPPVDADEVLGGTEVGKGFRDSGLVLDEWGFGRYHRRRRRGRAGCSRRCGAGGFAARTRANQHGDEDEEWNESSHCR